MDRLLQSTYLIDFTIQRLNPVGVSEDGEHIANGSVDIKVEELDEVVVPKNKLAIVENGNGNKRKIESLEDEEVEENDHEYDQFSKGRKMYERDQLNNSAKIKMKKKLQIKVHFY